MGGAPKYNRFKAFISSVRTKELKDRQNTINVIPGKGRYPKCLKELPYDTCPKELNINPKKVPDECKNCPHYTESGFDSENKHKELLERLKKSGLPTVIEG